MRRKDFRRFWASGRRNTAPGKPSGFATPAHGGVRISGPIAAGIRLPYLTRTVPNLPQASSVKLNVTPSIVLAAAVLVLASAMLLRVLPADTLMSIDSDFLSGLVRPGVIVWWLVLAEPNSYAPPSPGQVVFAAIANGALWLLALLFAGAVGRSRVTRLWFMLAAPALAVASLAALVLLVSGETMPSAVSGPFAIFAEPGVSMWWLLLGGLFNHYPTSMSGMAFAAMANAAFWLALFGMVVVLVNAARRLATIA